MVLRSADEFDLSWPEFRDKLETAKQEKIARLPQLERLRTAKLLQVYGYGLIGRQLVSQLQKNGIRCMIYDNNPLVRKRALIDGFEVIDRFDPTIPIVVAVGQSQIEIMDSLIKDNLAENAYYLLETSYALNLINGWEKSKYFSDSTSMIPERLYTIYKFLNPKSRAAFLEVLQYRVSLNVRHLLSRQPMTQMWTPPVANLNIQSFCDIGAYDGDTLEAIKRLYPALAKSFTIEPNEALASAIAAMSDRLGVINTNFIGACWSHTTRLSEIGCTDGMYTVSECETGNIAAQPLDALLCDDAYDYIKMDVESTELMVILGGIKSLNHATCIAVASYHLAADIISLPTQLMAMLRDDQYSRWELYFTHSSQTFNDSIFFFVKTNRK